MTPKQRLRAAEVIATQMAMNSLTIEALRNAGLSESREVQIDFLFVAPDEVKANALAAHLSANDCLSVLVRRNGSFFSRKYLVEGKTYPTLVNERVLAEWLPWIVVQGAVLDCEFDGWGTEV
ncbi:hypothetical protein H3H37_00310 [Duganella sp. LX20W]|uniref:Uncharacterized protein n=1 Tax=Rugamonas brunnea TaxID=2758569 RepID=A0A7W2EN83_9BURK|nr:ribonuclease E inhibitor RraB [Rugamonas brunnea]MBA5635511.1 hypothetical protein [Rugamonas brunnea]